MRLIGCLLLITFLFIGFCSGDWFGNSVASSGTNGDVHSIVTNGTQTFVGGWFNSPFSNVARLNLASNSFENVGALTSYILSLKFNDSNQNLYAGGYSLLKIFDGSSWSDVGN